jgi:SAM-dependent methyltransferase
MNCCCPHSNSANRFFSFFAGSYRRRFEKKGFEPSQMQLLEGLEQAGYQDAAILEIGSGVGHLHQTLLERGASSAVGVDLASKMIDEARHWAQERELTERTDYVPDADGLVHSSLRKTSRVYALTYPRDRWYVRAMIGIAALFLKIIRSDFRPYVHAPESVERWITQTGFDKHYENHNGFWLTQVYVKP